MKILPEDWKEKPKEPTAYSEYLEYKPSDSLINMHIHWDKVSQFKTKVTNASEFYFS